MNDMLTSAAQTPAAPTRRQIRAIRLLLLTWGLVGIAWPLAMARDRLLDTPFENMAFRINTGQAYDYDVLARTSVRDPDPPGCDLNGMRQHLIVRSELLNAAIESGAIDQIDAVSDELWSASERLLICEPSDSFSWLMRYWLMTRRVGLTPDTFAALERSYRFGPREAWIAVRRNQLAISVFDYLPATLKAQALTEYVDLLRAYVTSAPVEVFVRSKPNVRRALMDATRQLPDTLRNSLLSTLEVRVADFDFRPYDPNPVRPWR